MLLKSCVYCLCYRLQSVAIYLAISSLTHKFAALLYYNSEHISFQITSSLLLKCCVYCVCYRLQSVAIYLTISLTSLQHYYAIILTTSTFKSHLTCYWRVVYIAYVMLAHKFGILFDIFWPHHSLQITFNIGFRGYIWFGCHFIAISLSEMCSIICWENKKT